MIYVAASRRGGHDGVDKALDKYAIEPLPSELLCNTTGVDECFAGDKVESIVAALRGRDAGPANDAADLIATRSPIRAVGDAGGGAPRRQPRDTQRCLTQDYWVSSASPRLHDLVEGTSRS